jgi:hypothetical protein
MKLFLIFFTQINEVVNDSIQGNRVMSTGRIERSQISNVDKNSQVIQMRFL